MKRIHYSKDIKIILFSILAFSIILIIYGCIDMRHNNIKWNNGYCTECKTGKWEYISYNENSTHAWTYYKCNKCGAELSLDEKPRIK